MLRAKCPRPQTSGGERPGRGRARRRDAGPKGRGPGRPEGPTPKGRKEAREQTEGAPGAERNYFARSDGERREREGAKAPRANAAQVHLHLWPLPLLLPT